jgi:hypothetical protein
MSKTDHTRPTRRSRALGDRTQDQPRYQPRPALRRRRTNRAAVLAALKES